ncbi:Nrap protein [Penicillium robsamsonii]|uniref:Nrap protein n=1 Tax=Penicillium robsamsonii TaxID=1792511 RepID=UPI0025477D29|nr:Nrap protein [Penicillium robsamsonii]KAJ5816875.1 Nrap protein [Penicillium robsamsonii]
MSDHTSKRRKLSPSPENAVTSSSTKQTSKVTEKRNPTRGKDERSAELAMASGFYKSSFFKLQMDDLLAGLRPNYSKQVSKVQETLHKIKTAIESLPEKSPQSVPDAEKELRASGLVVPWPEPRPSKDVKYSMAYAKPANINVVGSFALKTGARTLESRPIDLAVTMPSSLFQEKDYVNFRYFHKRAYYIACVAAGIQDLANTLGLDIKFAPQDGDSLRPLILLEPRKAESSRPTIRILTAIDPTLFPITRTLPLKSNIRQASNNSEIGEPTSYYNASLRSDATVSLYHKSIYSASKKCDSFSDACILGRTWLQQRGFHTPFQNGGFGGFEWTVLLSLLFEGGGPAGQPVLLPSYSCYQIFKATIQFLAGRDLTTPLFFGQEVPVPSGVPVVFDGRRGLNILYKMTPWSYTTLRHEAAITLKMLNESREDNFDKVFILKVNEPALRFDRLISFPKSFNGDTLRALHEQNALFNVLSRALGDRVKLVSIVSHAIDSWSVKSKQPKRSSQGVSVGLLLNAENVGRIVDHGPAAEEKEESASFQAFWGEKSELRRFKDGSILESLVWSDESETSIIYQILEYILQRHFKITTDEFAFVGDEYDELLKEHGDGILAYSSPAFQSIDEAFKNLEKSIRGMDEVPLEVRHLAPASSLLRYTSLRPTGATDVVLQFESSSRWPDDFAAIQMTKVAFLLKIGDSLESSGAASSCRVGLENESSKVINNAYLEIPHSSGMLFRLRIHHEREQILLERNLKDRNLSPREREEAAYALFAYKKTFVQTPRLTQALRSLCTRFPLLSPTIRLTKQWFNSHLFTAQISDELIELLVIRTFTQPNPWECPSSVMTGFLRTLHSLSRWDWQQEPFVVDLGGELTPQVTENIRTRFTAWRSIDPAMNSLALFVASDLDTEGVTWTQYEMPSKVVAARMSSLAKAAVSLLRSKTHDMDVSELFDTSLAPYDFVIHLRPKLFNGSSAPKYKNLAEPRAGMMQTIKSFVCDVQACYSQSILLFHGDDRCAVIAGLWNPQTLKSRTWNLKTAYSTAPGDTEGEVVINQTAILNEIARLGNGLIENIEVHAEE